MSRAPSEPTHGVPFSFFCSLLREISGVQPHRVGSRPTYNNQAYPARDIFQRWMIQLRKVYSPLPLGTTAIIFKLLFPEEDHARKYDMQETRLSQHLAECFSVNSQNFQSWCSENSSGCLGAEVKVVLDKICPTRDGWISPLVLSEVNELLNELAATSGYTHAAIRKKYPQATRRSRLCVLKSLFRALSPIDASFLTQIILKDLRPILYPISEAHYTAALIDYNAASVKMLTKEHAMYTWDPTGWFINAYRVKSTLDEAARSYELPASQRKPNVPQLGVPVTIPKSEKGRDPRHALGYFHRSQRVWVETKYDGERAQIHVEVRPDNTVNITIFSKSKRDSTLDRMGIHDVIYRALGLSKNGIPCTNRSKIGKGIILDAEMVAFHDEKIDEFWRIHGLVEQTAYGIRGTRRNIPTEYQSSSESCSQSSMKTDYSDSRRLGLVFFDILALNSASLLLTPYCQRRELLESLIHQTPGECMLAERVLITLPEIDDDDRTQIAFEKVFSDIIATHQEGVVLKGDQSKYHDFHTPWVKLKKDYISGHGDAVDLVIVGAAWEKERGRGLRVGPAAVTTFYIGGLVNAKAVRRQPSVQPHLHVYFTVSFGLTRAELENFNFLVKNSDSVPYSAPMSPHLLPYTLTMLPGLQPPSVILTTPLLAELFGAGFTKVPKSRHYELRFPRIAKIYRAGERSWLDGVDLEELHIIACDAIGRDSSRKEARDIVGNIWGKAASPGAKSSLKRKATSDLWEERFAILDNRTWAPDNVSPPSSPSPAAKKWTPNTRQKSTLQPLAIRTNAVVPRLPSVVSRCDITVTPPVPVLQSASTILPVTKTKAEDFRTESQTALRKAPSSPGMAFLENALVWFAGPSRKSTPSHNGALKRSIPRRQRLHSLESLLLGCGWHAEAHESPWAVCGVIYIDGSDAVGTEWKGHVLKVLQERQASVPAGGARRPIWVFDSKRWQFDEDKIEAQALWQLK